MHCTAKYIGKNHETGDKIEYFNDMFVPDSLGRACTLKIVGFSFSSKSVAADVSFDSDRNAKDLWKNDLEEMKKNEILSDNYFKNSNIDASKVFEELNPAERAHITLATVKGVPLVQSGVDLLNCKLRLKVQNENNHVVKKDFQIRIPNFNKPINFDINYLNDGFCYVKLKEALSFSSLFAAEY